MKFYKNVTKILTLSLLAFALIFVSCKDDDKEPETVDNNEIVGKWKFSAIAPETAGTNIGDLSLITTLVPCAFSLTLTFESNNKVTPADCELAVQGLAAAGFLTVGQDTKWKVENNTLKLTNGTTVQTLPLQQSSNLMKITVNTNTTGSGAAVNAVLTFTRV
ncbi:hypothetical protein [Dyadobacter psychrotolerans]|uniref:Lipocalin-like domain-containing protein n=1 Tax=Dyadobacter psychrotolerans TaxID=2541721 RepID=A0A4R5D8Y7_9BACT|nr:hypothetical protein [Dyadobacter psychrotolerans]TDE09986.1 hypothetical protein E0F88_29090 [Dyadobacter psychrotolerans]